MKSGLTRREKILIAIGATVLALFAAGNFLIIPAYNDYVEKSERVTDLRFEKMDVEMKIAGKPGVEAMRDRARGNYDDLAALFHPKMTNYEIDNLMTGIIVNHNLDPTFLGITNTADSEGAVSNELLKISADADYRSIQRLIDSINATDYIYITSFNYSIKDGGVVVDIDFCVQTLDASKT